MRRPTKPPTTADAWNQLAAAGNATRDLRRALESAKYAKAPRLITRIRLAISSAKGAERHAACRLTRAYRQLPDQDHNQEPAP